MTIIKQFLASGAVALALAACSNVEVHTVNIQTAAGGTLIEAEQVVTLVYRQASDDEIEKLLYSGGDLTRAIQGLRNRYPQLKNWLNKGVIGNTASGFVALREESFDSQLHELLWDENRDRAFLHNQASAAVGHGGRNLMAWLPYASSSFGTEWIKQGQATWWWMDEQHNWHQGNGDKPQAAR